MRIMKVLKMQAIRTALKGNAFRRCSVNGLGFYLYIWRFRRFLLFLPTRIVNRNFV